MTTEQQHVCYPTIGQSTQTIKTMLHDLLEESQGLPDNVQQQVYRAINSIEAYEELVLMEIRKLKIRK